MKFSRTTQLTLNAAAAASASLLIVTTTLAAGLGAIAAIPGTPFGVTGTAQATAVAQVVGSRVEVIYSAAPAFIGYFPAAAGTMTTLNGPGFRLSCDHAGARPIFTLAHTGAVGFDIVEIRLIGRNNLGGKKYCFDRTLPNPGTAGGLAGADIAYLGGAGGWLAGPEYSDRVNVVGTLAQNDTYMRLRVKFSTPFVSNNYLSFGLDIDRIF